MISRRSLISEDNHCVFDLKCEYIFEFLLRVVEKDLLTLFPFLYVQQI